VLPDDVQTLAGSVLEHRLLLAPAVAEGERAAVVAGAVAGVSAL
jgi:hypothetical protein